MRRLWKAGPRTPSQTRPPPGASGQGVTLPGPCRGACLSPQPGSGTRREMPNLGVSHAPPSDSATPGREVRPGLFPAGRPCRPTAPQGLPCGRTTEPLRLVRCTGTPCTDGQPARGAHARGRVGHSWMGNAGQPGHPEPGVATREDSGGHLLTLSQPLARVPASGKRCPQGSPPPLPGRCEGHRNCEG